MENILVVSGDNDLHFVDISSWSKCDCSCDTLVNQSSDNKHISTFSSLISICDKVGDIIGYESRKYFSDKNNVIKLNKIFSIKLTSRGQENQRYTCIKVSIKLAKNLILYISQI